MKTVFLLSDEENGMTITQLKYVITVAESNSMNEAAGKLFISQPSLSASIKELENESRYYDNSGRKRICRICKADCTAV